MNIELAFSSGTSRVSLGAGVLEQVGASLRDLYSGGGRILVVTDSHVGRLFGPGVMESLGKAGLTARLAAVPPGDASKSLGHLSFLYEQLSAFGVGRDGAILALGGGMVSDLAGFAAATWMRGIAFLICPTTLESAVDACLGGKTGINHPDGKNLIGAFHHPRLVLIDPAALSSLPDRTYRAGLAESIKHAAVADPNFLDWQVARAGEVLERDSGVLVELIARNLRIKGSLVAQDEREQTGRRAVLNFGHTVGHALESFAVYRLLHGECVGLGMLVAARLSVSKGMLPEDDSGRIRRAIEVFGLPTRWPGDIGWESLQPFMERDKKNRAGRIREVLLEGLGRPVLTEDITPTQWAEALKEIEPG